MDQSNRLKAVDAMYAAGHYLYSNDRTKDAIDVFRTMLLAAPTDERGWLGLGACHELIGEANKALKLYALGTKAASSHARIELAKARIFKVIGELHEMRDAYDLAEEAASQASDEALLGAIRAERGTP